MDIVILKIWQQIFIIVIIVVTRTVGTPQRMINLRFDIVIFIRFGFSCFFFSIRKISLENPNKNWTQNTKMLWNTIILKVSRVIKKNSERAFVILIKSRFYSNKFQNRNILRNLIDSISNFLHILQLLFLVLALHDNFVLSSIEQIIIFLSIE